MTPDRMSDKRLTAIKARLLDLAEDRKTFFRDDGDDEVFREDYDALIQAVALITERDRLAAEAKQKDDLIIALRSRRDYAVDALIKTKATIARLTAERFAGEATEK